ncbi:MAG: c-type cytochrome [Sphingomonas sp.]|nr:c-type cytochrome [Sphingomonas sp.]
MKMLFRWLGYALAGLTVLALAFVGWVWFTSAQVLGARHEAAPERLAAPTPVQLADAGRQARILGCVNCHGEGLRGRMMADVPNVVRLWAPNLNELATRVSDQQLAQAIRQGIGADGRALFDMPSEVYARLTDQEVAALIAYIRSVPRAGAPVSPLEWGPIGRFALASGGIRPAMAMIEEFRVTRPYDLGAEHAAGRRLAEVQCAGCHGPDLTGGEPMPEVLAPDLTIAGAYDRAQFRTLMRAGVAPHGRDLGLMREIAENDTRHYSDTEIDAIHAYLVARAERLAR